MPAFTWRKDAKLANGTTTPAATTTAGKVTTTVAPITTTSSHLATHAELKLDIACNNQLDLVEYEYIIDSKKFRHDSQ